MDDLNMIRARLYSIAPTKMEQLSGSIRRLLEVDLPKVLNETKLLREALAAEIADKKVEKIAKT